METIEENSSNALTTQEQTSASTASTTSSIVHLISSQANSVLHPQTQSVIQTNNQHSVIQSATGIQPVKSVLLVNSKPNSVIHTTQAIQIKPELNMIDSDDSDNSDDDSPKKRRDLLTRRPSYRKILNDLGGGNDIGGTILSQSGNPDHTNLHSGSGTIVQYSNQDGNLVSYVPVNLVGNNVIAEDQSRKREMRLLKNREAARECRRKKKEYIKCLENRVAVLENQNKALIEELKSLKELYCQQKNE